MLKDFYSYSLSDDEYNKEQIVEIVPQLDHIFQECETVRQDIAYLEYVDTVRGIDIYHCYGTGDYYFCDVEEE